MARRLRCWEHWVESILDSYACIVLGMADKNNQTATWLSLCSNDEEKQHVNFKTYVSALSQLAEKVENRWVFLKYQE